MPLIHCELARLSLRAAYKPTSNVAQRLGFLACLPFISIERSAHEIIHLKLDLSRDGRKRQMHGSNNQLSCCV